MKRLFRSSLQHTGGKPIFHLVIALVIVAAAVGTTSIWAEERARREQEKAFNTQQSLQTMLARQAMSDYLRSLFDNAGTLARYTLFDLEMGRQTVSLVRGRFMIEQTANPDYLYHAYYPRPDEPLVEKMSYPETPAARDLAQHWSEIYWSQLRTASPQAAPLVPPFALDPQHQWMGILYPVTADGSFRGLMVVVVDLGPLIRRYIQPMHSGQFGSGYLLDSYGSIVYDEETQIIGQNIFGGMHAAFPEVLAIDQRMVREPSGVGEYRFTVARGGEVKRKLVAWDTVPVGSQQLVVALAAPESEIDANLSTVRTQRNVLSIIMGLVMLAFSVSFLTQSRRSFERQSRELENRVAERSAELMASQETLRAVFDVSPLPIVLLDGEGRVSLWNPAAERLFGWSAHELLGKPNPIIPPDRQAEYQQLSEQLNQAQRMVNLEVVRQRRDGTHLNLQLSTALLHNSEGQVSGRMAIMADLSDRKQLEEEARFDDARLQSLVRITQQRNGSLTHLLDLALEEALALTNSQVGYIFYYSEASCVFTLHAWSNSAHQNCTIADAPMLYPLESTGLWGEVVRQRRPIVINDLTAELAGKKGYPPGHVEIRRFMSLPVFSDNQIVAVVGMGNKPEEYTDLDVRELDLMMDSVWKIAEREVAQEQLRQSNQRLAALDQVSQSLAGIHLNFQATLESVANFAAHWSGDICYIGILSENQLVFQNFALSAADPQVDEYLHAMAKDGSYNSPESDLIHQVIQDGQPIFILKADLQLLNLDQTSFFKLFERFGVRSLIILPLQDQRRVFGVLTMVRLAAKPNNYTVEDRAFLGELANRAALGISNANLYEDNQVKLRHLQALYSIETAITSSLDMASTLNIIVNQIVVQLQVDAANILLYNQNTQRLDLVAGCGFRSAVAPSASLRLGNSPAGVAARERQILMIPDLSRPSRRYESPAYFHSEGFVTYYGLPLIARGQLRGVLEIFHRTLLTPNQEWNEVLQTLVGQAAIAVDHAALFEDLQRSNFDLTLAYDETIEGWSRALDLRDNETEGHSRRVTDLTERLARRLGVSDLDLIHIRRGALLHDIGKVGIPDQILLKPGSLDEDEWKVMQRHPQMAFDMLYPIQYLRPALDIPLAHHEKWDGSGYPRQLKGAKIPLAARIFAVVDVYDALTSDRPYRSKWPLEKVLAFINGESGHHFDPSVVEDFLKMMQEDQ